MKMTIKLGVNQSDVDFEQYLQECEVNGYKIIKKNNKECSLQDLHNSFKKGAEKE